MSESFRIRATRAAPLGLAHDDPDRRAVYGAALGQFQELMTAAKDSSAASRPLPLFYALSQAERAIAADRVDDAWHLRGHGLIAPDLDGQIVDISVHRQRKDKPPVDSFAGVARATGGVPFDDAVTIGALWKSLPEIFELLPASVDVGPLPMRFAVEPDPKGLRRQTDPAHVHAVAIDFDGSPDELDKCLNEHYPTSTGMSVHRPFPGQPVLPASSEYGRGLPVRWNLDAAHHADMDSIAAALVRYGWCWLRPSVGGIALSPLLSWWTLLFGLSMLARYEPAGWAAALAVESSELAVPLEELLDIALDRVPELIFDALSAEQA